MPVLTIYRPQDSDWSEVFTVLVGKEETSFTLHKTAYCQSSSYFKGALSKGWKENEDGVVRLAHADSRDFRIYVDYVYGRGLNDEDIDTQFFAAIDTQIAENDLILRYKINRLCRLWVLGDYLGDPDFQNEVIDQLIDHTFEDPRDDELFDMCPKTLKFVWDSTPSGSVLRQWAVDAVARTDQLHGWVKAHGSRAPKGFIKWLLAKTLQREDKGYERTHKHWKKSDYHLVRI